MKKRWRVMVVLAAILVLGGLFRLIGEWRTVGSLVVLSLVTNSTNQPASGAVLHITNGDERAILLTDLIVETNSATGWEAFSHTTPTHPQRLATRETKDLIITRPSFAKTWRLRVTYGKDVKGPMLLLGKAGYAISQHGWPGPGFGIMSGSNSCISDEMRSIGQN
jgi:hypothetical protein